MSCTVFLSKSLLQCIFCKNRVQIIPANTFTAWARSPWRVFYYDSTYTRHECTRVPFPIPLYWVRVNEIGHSPRWNYTKHPFGKWHWQSCIRCCGRDVLCSLVWLFSAIFSLNKLFAIVSVVIARDISLLVVLDTCGLLAVRTPVQYMDTV